MATADEQSKRGLPVTLLGTQVGVTNMSTDHVRALRTSALGDDELSYWDAAEADGIQGFDVENGSSMILDGHCTDAEIYQHFAEDSEVGTKYGAQID